MKNLDRRIVYSAIIKANKQANTELFGHQDSAATRKNRLTLQDLENAYKRLREMPDEPYITPMHPDRFAAMADQEKPEKRPSCGYKVSDPTGRRPCGSEDGLRMVKGSGKFGKMPRETPVCREHMEKAIREWDWNSVDPLSRRG